MDILFRFFRKKPNSPKIFEPTGQPLEEVMAIRRRAETETDEERCKRLGVTSTVKGVDTEGEKKSKKDKDTTLIIDVSGEQCTANYHSDYRLIEKITDPEEYYYDNRKWVDVFFRGAKFGYSWDSGAWTHNSNGLFERDEIELCINEALGVACEKIAIGEITTTTETTGLDIIFYGCGGSIQIKAWGKPKGRIVQIEIDKRFRGNIDIKSGEVNIPLRYFPAQEAIIVWATNEYARLKRINS